MLDPAVLIGSPLIFNNIKIYPPLVKDVVTNPNFNVFYKVLTLTQEDVSDEVGNKLGEGEAMPTPFEYLFLSCQYIQGFDTIVREAFDFFCRTEIVFLFEERKVLVDDGSDYKAFLTEENFFDFQNVVRAVCGDKPIKPPEPIDPDEDPRVTEIKRRARERDKIKARQGSKNGISLNTCLTAICCMGLGITPLNIGEMSYASVGEIMKVMQNKEKYDIDIRSLLAGADSKKIKPKYWIRNTDKE